MGNTRLFAVADYLVFTCTLVISISIGVYYALSGGRQRTTSEFMVAGRMMSFLPVGISMLVSFESSIMMLGLPAEAYRFGVQVVVANFSAFVMNLLCAWIAVPLIYPLNITSGYEYLELRFKSRFVRLLGSCMDILFNMWYMGIVLFGPAVALEAVTDFPFWMSLGGLAFVSVIYTSIGGLKAVIWTDVFQAAIMFVGIFAVLIKGTINAGGAKAVWDSAEKGGRMQFFDFSIDPRTRHTFWNLSLSGIFQGFSYAFKQSGFQRISSTRSKLAAKRALLFVAPCSFLLSTLAVYEGIVSYAYYDTKQCDPFKAGHLRDSNQIVPYIVLDIFYQFPGMPGLFLAALFSASLSTLSSSLSSLSALIWTDLVHPVVGDVAEWKATLFAKISVVVCGVVACGLAGLISLIGGTLHQIAKVLLAAVSGPLTGLFLLGCFVPRSTAKGVSIGGIAAIILTLWISTGKSFTPGLKKTPFLPPASTAKCHLGDVVSNDTALWIVTGNRSWAQGLSDTMESPYDALTTTLKPVVSALQRSPHGVDHLYTISYTLIGPIGTIMTLVLGYIFSILTGPNKPGDVDPRYILSVSDSLLVWLPQCIRRFISSKGTQFIIKTHKGQEKINGDLEAKACVVSQFPGVNFPRDDHGDLETTNLNIPQVQYKKKGNGDVSMTNDIL